MGIEIKEHLYSIVIHIVHIGNATRKYVRCLTYVSSYGQE